MSAAQLIRRGLLYIPASSQKMLEKSRSLAVDCVAYDLEDSVAPDRKAGARRELRQFLDSPRPAGVKEVAVRINSVDSGLALDDLTEVLKSPNVDAIVLPKVQRAADLHFVTDAIRHLQPDRHSSSPTSRRPPLRILSLMESAKGLVNLNEICRASPYLSGLIFAAEDFCLDLSITRTPSLTELLFARSALVTAARAHDLPSAIDLVCTSFRGDAGLCRLEEECADGRRLGFNGKQLIHPGQIEIASRLFAPGEAELEWAVRVVIANRKAEAQGRGAWTLDGKMIDAPVVGMARSIVTKARACEMEVDGIEERWKSQEPE